MFYKPTYGAIVFEVSTDTIFHAVGFFTWVTDKKSSWILIYFQACKSIYTQIQWLN